jgi:nitrite reductase (NADH) small subunit
MEKALIINLGSVEDIPIGQGRCFIIKDEEIAVFRSRNGKITAMDNKCPHRGGPLADGIIDEGKVICPLHGHKFNLKTGQGSEQQECVRIFSSWIEHSNIYLEYTPNVTIKDTKACV